MVVPNTQAAKAAAQGGVTSFADNAPQEDGIQEANFLIRKLITGGSVKKGTRVPEEATEGLLPPNPDSGKQTTYTEQKRKLQDELLSPTGKQRLEDAGGDTGIAINTPVDPDNRVIPRLDMGEKITATAKKALNDQPTGLADEGDAEDLLALQKPEMLVDTETGIDFNFANMDTTEDMNRTINAMSEIIANPTEAAKRGVQTNQETLDKAAELLGDEIGLTKKLMNKNVGQLLNAEEMTAVRILLNRSAEKLSDLAKQIKDGDDSSKTLIEFRRQMAVHAGIQMKAKGAQTEIARALQAFNIRTDANIPLNAAQDTLNETGGGALAKDLALAYLKKVDEVGQTAANKFVFGTFMSKTRDAWLEVYINGMLSYFPTHMKNALGTPIFMTYNILADLVGATAGTAMRATGLSNDAAGVSYEDIFARATGYLQAMGDAFVIAGRTFATEDPASQFNKVEAANLRALDSNTLGLAGAAGRAIDHLGKLIRIPGAALMAADDFWRVIAGRGELYEQAIRQVRISKASGKSQADAVDDGLMVLLDPRFSGEELDAAARYATLTDDMGEQLTAGTKLIRTIAGRFLGNILMPFVKAPTNTIRRVAEGNPMMVAVSMFNPKSTIRQNLTGQNGARAQQRAIGRLTLGSATLAYFHNQATQGNLTGSYPRDKQSQKMLPKGWKPYSLVFIGNAEQRKKAGLNPWPVDSDGDPLPKYNAGTGLPNEDLIYLSYQGLEPVSAILGIAAATAQNQQFFYNPEDRMDLISAGVLATFDYMSDLAMLQTLGNVSRALSYADMSILTDNPVSGTVGVFPQPFSSVVRNIDRLTNTEKRTLETPVEYMTVEDVERMYAGSQGSSNPLKQVPYELVGTPKNTSILTEPFKAFQETVINGWHTQLMNIPYVNERIENFAYSYDMLGNKKERGIDFGVNPMLALWNSATPFKISFGEKPELYHEELIRLGAPLSETKEQIQGIRIGALVQSDLNRIAKNEIALPVIAGQAAYPFREHLQVLMSSSQYSRADDEGKTKMIKRAESKFYEAAWPYVLAMDEHKNLAQAYSEREYIRNIGR